MMRLRVAHMGDMAGVGALLARSYPRLLKQHYLPSVMVTALPLISRPNPLLLSSGTYYVIEDAGAVLAAGGWTQHGPQGTAIPGVGHIRHVASDPDRLRQGLASRLLRHSVGVARAEGLQRLDCLSTLTAVPFYMQMGFEVLGRKDITLQPGITFPVVAMYRGL